MACVGDGGFVHHLLRAAEFLLRDEGGRVGLQGLLELGDGFVKLAGIAQNLAAMHFGRSRQEAGPLKRVR